MLNNFLGKLTQLITDPVLRQWSFGKVIGRWPGEPSFTPHRPEYLETLPNIELKEPKPPKPFDSIISSTLQGSLQLPLPGATVVVDSENPEACFRDKYKDIETCLALHRFAWVPVLGQVADPQWVDALWRAWCQLYQEPDDNWAWHPYTAAERIINILDFAKRAGLPGDQNKTLSILARHGPAIAERLEYFGEHNTSNHLSNNGRGLYRLGLALGLSDCIGRGADILLKEAARIFLPSGILREGSSHYHLLLTRNYIDAWLAAREYKRAEERPLRAIVQKALSVIPSLFLPGRFPLIGDISPDCPPDYLIGINSNNAKWLEHHSDESRQALVVLASHEQSTNQKELENDGWHRFDHGPWSGLWFVSPDGWAPMPGHGHHDCGGFELHYNNEPVFIDLGRGAYGDTGEAEFYRSGAVHNTLLIDGQSPYPPNKPYYTPKFRRSICGNPPTVQADEDSITVTHDGYSRLRGVKTITRNWQFNHDGFELTDTIDGTRRAHISRCLHTTLPAEPTEDGVQLFGSDVNYQITTNASVLFKPSKAWIEYGNSVPATSLIFEETKTLPSSLQLTIRVTDKNA